MASLISIQLNSGNNIVQNLDAAQLHIQHACEQADKERLVVLPECFSLFGVSGKDMLAAAELMGTGLVQRRLSEMATVNNCFIVAGSMPIKPSQDANKYFAASLVFSPNGECIARYNKIHLFDVTVNDSTSNYCESAYTMAGQHLSLFNTGFADVGQSVCYDLRFAAMFSAYTSFTESKQAPMVIVVPSAFTQATGKAHWHTLLRARSIENQCFIVASNQTGTHVDGRETFGHSCIYSPWGSCLSVVEKDVGFAIAKFDLETLKKVRSNMPIHDHKKERYQIES
ncbi:MAG: carbon-nitrogen hydrolase family protein [Glaciecola sp.]